MVRLAENTRLVFDPGTVGGSWMVLQLPDEDVRLRRTDDLEFRRLLRSAAQMAHRIATVDGVALWMFREAYFWADKDLTQSEVQREIAWSVPTA
jgi:hypothetical protein